MIPPGWFKTNANTSKGTDRHNGQLGEPNQGCLLCEFVDRCSPEREDGDPERSIHVMHALSVSSDDRSGEPTATKHDLLVVSKFVILPHESLLHRTHATDCACCRRSVIGSGPSSLSGGEPRFVAGSCASGPTRRGTTAPFVLQPGDPSAIGSSDRSRTTVTGSIIADHKASVRAAEPARCGMRSARQCAPPNPHTPATVQCAIVGRSSARRIHPYVRRPIIAVAVSELARPVPPVDAARYVLPRSRRDALQIGGSASGRRDPWTSVSNWRSRIDGQASQTPLRMSVRPSISLPSRHAWTRVGLR